MLKPIFSAILAALALSSIAAAKDEAAAPPPPPELKQYDYFLGTWHCSGKVFASPMGPEHATTGTVHAARVVGGHWVHLSYDENRTAANPAPYHAGVYWGYDSAMKTFVQNCHDSLGGYCNQTSSGWNGDVLVFEGASLGMAEAAQARDTFTKKGANEVVHAGAMQGPDKKWITLDEETCRKGK